MKLKVCTSQKIRSQYELTNMFARKLGIPKHNWNYEQTQLYNRIKKEVERQYSPNPNTYINIKFS